MDENDDQKTEVTEHNPATSKVFDRLCPESPLMDAINAWRQAFADYKNSRPNPIAAASAAEARARYRLKRELEGKTVRPSRKHKHLPLQFGETHEDYCKRTHRDRQRTYRKSAGKNVRGWTDLSMLSEEEKAAHIKAQNTERQRRWRAKTKTVIQTSTQLSPEMTACLREEIF